MAQVHITFGSGNEEVTVDGVQFNGERPDVATGEKIIDESMVGNFRSRSGMFVAGRAADPNMVRFVVLQEGVSRVVEMPDAFGGFGMALSTNPPESIVKAVVAQMEKGTPVFPRTTNHDLLAATTTALRGYLGMPDAVFLFGLSGTFVADAACAIVFHHWAATRNLTLSADDPRWGDTYIVAMDGNLHGSTMLGRALATSDATRANLGPNITANVRRVPFGDVNKLEEVLKPQGRFSAAGLIIEPVQGSAGCIAPPEGYLRRVEEMCRNYNVPLIFDEIKTGCGRTGTDWAFERYGVLPDIVLGGKAIGGGVYPASFLAARREFVEWVTPGMFSLTWSAPPGLCMAVLATLKLLSEQNLASGAERKGGLLRELLEEVQRKHPDIVTSVNGLGLCLSVGTVFPNHVLADALFEEDVYTQAIVRTKDLVYMTPPILTTDELIRKIAAGFERAIIRLRG